MITVQRDDPETIVERLAQKDDLLSVWCVGAVELAPTTGRPHIHFCVTFKTVVRMEKARQLLSNGINDWMYNAHFTLSNSYKASRDYCIKEGITREKAPPAIERKELQKKVVHALLEAPTKETLVSLVEEHPQLLTHYGQISRFQTDAAQSRRGPRIDRQVIYCYGDSGVGKSHWAHGYMAELCLANGEKPDAYDVVHFEGGFGIGYTGSKYVIFDDWRPPQLPVETWNQLLDKYPYTINMKGHQLPWNAEVIIITRTHSPPELAEYGLRPDEIVQLLRRFTEIKQFVCIIDDLTGAEERDWYQKEKRDFPIPGARYQAF